MIDRSYNVNGFYTKYVLHCPIVTCNQRCIGWSMIWFVTEHRPAVNVPWLYVRTGAYRWPVVHK